jgi:DNA-binding NarL/FixJ family response regulator
MLRHLVGELQGMGSANGRLSAREAQVLALLRRGHTTTKIAQQLDISPVTVRRHISSIMRKMDVDERIELMDTTASDRRAQLA